MSNFNDFINNLDESRKITLKRRYTENHPAVEVGKVARVRNKMLEAIADGKITQEEFNAILKEFSADSGKWMRRNAKYFSVSEDGISLSTFGKRALSSITVNESEEILFEAEVEMDAMDPDNKDFLKFLKKNRVKIIAQTMDGPAGGQPVITMQGKKKDLEKVLGDCEYGWCDEELAEYIEESVLTEAKKLDKKGTLAIAQKIADIFTQESADEKEYIKYTVNPNVSSMSFDLDAEPTNKTPKKIADNPNYFGEYAGGSLYIKDNGEEFVVYNAAVGSAEIERFSYDGELMESVVNESYSEREITDQEPSKEAEKLRKSVGGKAYWSRKEDVTDAGEYIIRYEMIKDGDAPYGLIILYYPPKQNKPYNSTKNGEFAIERWSDGTELYYGEDYKKAEAAIMKHAKTMDESVVTEAKIKVTKRDIKDIEDSGNIDIAYKKAIALLMSLVESTVTEAKEDEELADEITEGTFQAISDGEVLMSIATALAGMTTLYNADRIADILKKGGKKAADLIKKIGKDAGAVTEGRAFVAAARKAKDEGKEEFEYNGKTYPVTIKEENETQNTKMENKRMFESFDGFVKDLSNVTEESTVNEAVNASAYVKAGKLGYNDQFLGRKSLSKTLAMDLGLNPKNEFTGPWLGFDHVALYAIGKKGGTILADALSGKYTYDELKAAAADFLGIKESVVTEAVNTSAYVKAGKLGYNDQFLGRRSLSKTLALDLGFNSKNEFTGPWVGFDHVSLYAIGKKGGTILADALSGKYTYDELKAAAADFFGIKESKELVNEAFSSMKLQSILTSAGSMPKDFAKTFYQMAKIQLDKIQDVDIIEMDPDQARKEKRNRAVYLYFTTNEKPNPYAGRNSWGVTTIPANTLLGVTDGSNEWLAAEYSRSFGSKNRIKKLSKTKRNDGAGFGKSAANDTWGSGISSLSKVAELADRAYVLDLDILRARYSTEAKRDERTAAKKGAVAFKNDKDFKKENLDRYHTILADRAASMPIDSEVLKAIDIVTLHIKDGLTAGEKGRYGDVIIGKDPKGREVKLRDASNVMQNLLDDFNRYVDYTNQAKREEESGYGSSYYSREVKNYAKSIKDRISKIEKMDYAW
jgi:hypothetical protein